VIVVDALRQQPPAGCVPLHGVGLEQQAVVVGVEGVLALFVLDAHHRDQAVAVEVLTAVLVREPVVVLIEGRAVDGHLDLGLGEKSLRGVRIEAGDDIDRGRLEELGFGRLLTVLFEQGFDPGDGREGADEVIALGSCHDQHGRPGIAVLLGSDADIDEPDFAFLA
jgi:hypothetical protein